MTAPLPSLPSSCVAGEPLAPDCAAPRASGAGVPDIGPVLSMIERASRDPSIDIEKFERLMQMHDRVLARDAERAFNVAMSAAQSEMRSVAVDADNPQTKSKYASYHALDKALRPIYTKHGFALSFDTEPTAAEGFLRIVCNVTNDGYSRRYQIDMAADGKGAKGGDVMTKTHATGAAATYGMRYLLKMIFNVAIGENDDDGNGASGDVITDDQADEIRKLIDDIGNVNVPKFLEVMRAASVADIPAGKYKEAIDALKAKQAANAKKAAQ